MNIPSISDDRLAELAHKIRPVYHDKDGKLMWRKPCDLKRIAFTWNLEPDGEATGLERMNAVLLTFHEYGHPSLFKPSIKEVLAQIPEYYIKDVVAFELTGPEDSPEALNAGYHVGKVVLYEQKKV
ncbi:MAG TPA: hypothetical protein VNZ45_10005 [Bacteroidia bacterium]|jgi:hypothetical protein|nr:hypothetical protein [Bacteroidia bacterium]